MMSLRTPTHRRFWDEEFSMSPPDIYFQHFQNKGRYQSFAPQLDNLKRSKTDGSIHSIIRTGYSMKKSVTFADERGRSLEQIKLIHELSHEPPVLQAAVIQKITQGAEAGAKASPPLELLFTQPASEYQQFRHRLETKWVALENVILSDYHIQGTIKVKNVTYHKEVIVRYTTDKWKSSTDTPAKHCGNSSCSHLFDTFSFEIDVPTTFGQGDSVEFCVQYKTDDREFWDSNDGNNYKVGTKLEDSNTCPSLCEWGLFANWRNRDFEVPYW